MLRFSFLSALILLLNLATINSSQAQEWTWVAGSNLGNQPAVHGTKGLASSNNTPGGLWGAITWTDSNGVFWLFGGSDINANGNGRLRNDLWKWDGTHWTWVSGSKELDEKGTYGIKGIANSQNIPGARTYGVGWVDKNDHLWLFGGSGRDSEGFRSDLNDLWKWDGTNWTWVNGSDKINQAGIYGKKGIGNDGNVPGARDFHSGWVDSEGNFWLYGGIGRDKKGENTILGDLWKWDGTHWIWVSGANVGNQAPVYGTKGSSDPGNNPGGRNQPALWVDSNENVWLFGGRGDDPSGTRGWFSDLWKWDGQNWTWVDGPPIINQNGVYGTKGVADVANFPTARQGAVSWLDAEQDLWLFGGRRWAVGGGRRLNDLWKWDGSAWTWIHGTNIDNDPGVFGTKGVSQSMNVPGGRQYAMRWTDLNGNLWLYGGLGAINGQEFGDLWKFTIPGSAPKIHGLSSPQSIRQNANLKLFSTIVISDENRDDISGEITLGDYSTASISGTGVSGSGPYAIASMSLSSFQSVLRGLSFSGQLGQHTIGLSINDGDGGSDSKSLVVNTTSTSDPVFTSNPTSIIDDNKAYSYSVTTTDADGDNVTITAPVLPGWLILTSGNELKGDPTGQTGVFNVTLTASDGNGGNATQSFTVSVTDVTTPVFTSSASISFIENGTGTAYTGIATDTKAITYSLGNTKDEALFNIVGNTGVVTFKSAPDFENKLDANKDNAYEIDIKASDGTNVATKVVTITITDIPDETTPVITSATAISFAENTIETVYTIVATDDNVLSYSLGADNEEFLFNLTGSAITFRRVPNFEAPTDRDANNTYLIQVIVTDGANTAKQMVTITVTDQDESTLTFTSAPKTSIKDNEAYQYTITTSDKTEVSFTVNTKPSWLTFRPAQLVVETFAGEGTKGNLDGSRQFSRFNQPAGLTIDQANNIYIADSDNDRIRKISPDGMVSTVAGSFRSTIVDGNGTSAVFAFPLAITSDKAGNLYVGELFNHAVRKITPNGDVTTLAGNGTAGYADGTGTSAQFNTVYGIAVDASGNVYTSDWGNHVIRKITPTGMVSTFAGIGTAGFSDGTGTLAAFNNPSGLAIDPSGNIYVADGGNHRIRKITSGGIVSTLAGQSTSGFADGTGTQAQFSSPSQIAVDNRGDLYVTSSKRVRKVSTNGVVSTLAGNGTAGYVDGVGTNAQFNGAFGIAISARGDLFVSDLQNHRIRRIFKSNAELFGDPSGQTGSHNVALQASAGNQSINQNFTITVEQVINSSPTFTSSPLERIDQNAAYNYNIGVSDSDGHGVKVTATTLPSWLSLKDKEGPMVSSFAGSDTKGLNDGTGTQAAFNNPTSLAIDKSGNIYVADLFNHSIRKITPAGVVTTFVGSGFDGVRDGIGTNAQLLLPGRLAIDATGHLYVSSYTKIRKISPSGEVTSFVGSGSWGSADGTGAAASFASIGGMEFDSAGNLYVVSGDRIRKVTPAGVVSTLAGSGSQGYVDGTGTNASFLVPSGLAIDASDNLYVVDRGNDRIRKVTPAGVVSTFAGSGSRSFADGSGTLASFNQPDDITIDSEGNLYVSDRQNSRIRKITPAGVVSTWVGSGNPVFAEGKGTLASLSYGVSLAYAVSGNIYAANGDRIIRIERPCQVLTGDPNGQLGTENVSLTASDSHGGLATQNFTITVKKPNILPTFTSTPVTKIDDNINYDYKVETSDDNGDIVSITATKIPSWLSLKKSVGRTVSTLAGSGSNISADGTGTNASFSFLQGIAVDNQGNVYTTELGSYSIKKVTPDGVVSTFAGTGSHGSANGNGTNASFREPHEVIVNQATGNIYVLDASSIRKITPSGYVSNFVGSPDGFQGTADGTGNDARFGTLLGGDIDEAGNLYVADFGNHLVRKVTPAGVVTTLAGSRTPSFIDGTGTNAGFNRPFDIAVDKNGNLFVSDEGNDRIRKISGNGVVTTFLGSGSRSYADGQGTSASFDDPRGLAFDDQGNLFIADGKNNRIRMATPGGLVTTHAGSGNSAYLDGIGEAAAIRGPFGIAVIKNNLYVSTELNRIRKLTGTNVLTGNPKGHAGSYQIVLTANDGNEGIASPTTQNFTITVNHVNENPIFTSAPVTSVDDNQLYTYKIGVSDPDFEKVSITAPTIPSWLSLQTEFHVSTIAGQTSGFKDGTSTQALFNNPTGVAVDKFGNAFVVDRFNHRIRKISRSGEVSTFAGTGVQGYVDGKGSIAQFNSPYGIAIDNAGNLYISDQGLIRKIDPEGLVSTLAGSLTAGFADGQGSEAKFHFPSGLAVDKSGNVFVADRFNSRIRKVTPSGMVSTVAGDGSSATVSTPTAVAIDSKGNLFFSDVNKRIGKVSTDGTVTTYISNPYISLFSVQGIVIDASDNMYIVESDGGSIWPAARHGVARVDSPTSVTFLTGSSSVGFKDGEGTMSEFDNPVGIAVDQQGNLVVADRDNHRIRRISPVQVLKGNPINHGGVHHIVLNASDGAGGSAVQAFNLAVEDVTAPTIKTITRQTDLGSSGNPESVVFRVTFSETVHGIDVTDFEIKPGGATGSITSITSSLANKVADVKVKVPSAVGVLDLDLKTTQDIHDATNQKLVNLKLVNLIPTEKEETYDFLNKAPVFISSPPLLIDEGKDYFYEVKASDPDNNKVKIAANILPGWLSLKEGRVSTIAGSDRGFLDGKATEAKFGAPGGVAVDTNGNIYVTDGSNHKLRKISPDGTVSTLAGSTAGLKDGTGSSAQFGSITSAIVDDSGNIYVADVGNHRIRKITQAGVVTTFAGSTQGDIDGLGTNAQFDGPLNITIDSNGNFYVSDRKGVKKVTAVGNVTKLNVVDAGTSNPSNLGTIRGLAVDQNGHIYISGFDNKIRKISPSGEMTIFAGSTDGDVNGNLSEAKFGLPEALKFDIFGNLYIADYQYDKIRKITPEGLVTTFAGSSEGTLDGDRLQAQFDNPADIAIDVNGNLIIADQGSDRIRRIGVNSTLSGNSAGQAGAHKVELYATDGLGRSATQSFEVLVDNKLTPSLISIERLTPSDESVHTTNVVFMVRFSENVRHVDISDFEIQAGGASGKVHSVQQIDGQSTYRVWVTNVTGLGNLELNLRPTNNILDPGGNKIISLSPSGVDMTYKILPNSSPIFSSTPVSMIDAGMSYTYSPTVTDGDGHLVSVDIIALPQWLKFSYGEVMTVAGSINGNKDGMGTNAQFSAPTYAISDPSGNIYVSDRQNNVIRKIDQTGAVSIVAGSPLGVEGYGFINGKGTNAKFWAPDGLALDDLGNLYVADRHNHVIRKIDPKGNVSTYAGTGVAGFADGNASQAMFNQPRGIDIDASGVIYVADALNRRIRTVSPSGEVATLAGSEWGFKDGPGSLAQFRFPGGVAVDNEGNVYVGDINNHRVRKIDPLGNVTTLAGGVEGDKDGVGTEAQLNEPWGVDVSPWGEIFVAERGNNKIRKISKEGIVTTIAGSSHGDVLGRAEQSQFYRPIGIHIGPKGFIYIVDGSNHKIKKISRQIVISGPTVGREGTHNVKLTASDGLGGVTDQTFTITVKDITIPTMTSMVPINGAAGVKRGDDLVLTFSEKIQKGTGNVTVHRVSDDVVVATIDVTGSEVSVADKVVTINPTADLPDGIGLYVKIPATAFTDGTNSFAGINDKTSWRFTTLDVTSPSVEVTSPSSNLIFGQGFRVGFKFSEEVTGFEVSDVTLKNGTISGFTGSGKNYTAEIKPITDGEVEVSVASAVAADVAGNPNMASNTLKRQVEATNTAPTALNLSASTIAENSPKGTEVGELSAVDPDIGDQHAFALVQGEGDTDNALFGIVNRKLRSKAIFDYETKKEFKIRLRVTDARGLSLDAVKTIEVTNVAEPVMSIFMPRPNNPTEGTAHLAFIGTRISQTRTRTIEVSNTGSDGDLVISGVEVPTAFSIDENTATIAQGQKKVFTVTFTPTDEKVYAGDLVITSNAGTRKINTGGRGTKNHAPIAVTPLTAAYYKLNSQLKLRGFDPDGDAIEFQITQQPALGLLTEVSSGVYVFQPNALTPGTLNSDAIKFKVVEVGGGLSSEEAELKFNFRIGDQSHDITNFEVTSKTADKLNFNLAFNDAVLNDAYRLKVSYYDLSTPTAPVFVQVLNEQYQKASLTTSSTGASIAFEVPATGNAYLFNTPQVFMSVELTTANGFSDSEAYILQNDASGARVTVEGGGSDDGEFFVFASATTVPENESVDVSLFAIELGAFSLESASIEITAAPLKGTATSPTVVKQSSNLAQWKLTYSSASEIGLLDSLQFSVLNPGRSETAKTYAKITVIEVNDAPTLTPVADQQTNEEQAINIDLSITDPDSELEIIATTSEGTNAPVTVVGHQLQVTPAKDFTGDVNLSVLVKEKSGTELLSAFDEFVLTVVPVNDKPVVTAIDDITINEDSQIVVTLAATDVDAELPIFTYAASVDSDTKATYSIDGSALTITPAANFNGTITFNVTADDGLGTSNSVSAAEPFVVTVSPVNDAPVVSATMSAQSIIEGFPSYNLDLAQYFTDQETASEDLVYTVSAVNNVTLSITSSVMTIVPVSGSAGVETATVTASDGSLSVQQNITFVTTTASGDVTVANPIGNLSLDEDFGTSSIDLSSVFSYSADANASFTYSLSGNNNLGASMNGQTLELTSPVDFNGTDALFIVGTTDGKSSFTNFTITVNAVNDAPTLQNSLTDETAPEDASFSKVISASAFTDIDGDALTYTASFTAGWLSFDASTRTFSGTPTNADVGTVAVTLTAKDPSGATATDSFDLTVTNTNDNPTDITTAATAIDENVAVGTTVTTLTSIDPDVGDDSFTYALVAGTGGQDNDMFEISGNTLKTKAGVDFESKASYSIRVQTTDGFEGSYSEVLTITVNNVNEAVTGVSLDKLTIDENKSIGTAVGTLSSTDLDSNDSFTYGLVSGTGDTDNAQFTIADGALNTAAAFDFETKTSYSIRVKSTDAGGLSFEQVMTISVNNVNEVATAFTAVSTSIDENEPSGMTLGGFTVTDPDASDTHTYAMVAGEGDEDNASFKISGSKLATAAVLDFETKSSYSVRVSATDAGGLSIENTFTIILNDINEAATDLLLDNQSIPENTAIGTAIGAFTAVDQDAGDTHTFGLVAGEGDTDNASFEISSGNLVTKSALDFETQNSYSVRVETADAGGLTYWKVFTITVSDVGEATIETSSQSLAFELTEVGKTAELSFEISNNGDGVLAVSGIVLPTGYMADWTSGEVAASASQTVKVTFTPTDAVVYAGQINVESNAGDIVIEVTGEGQVVTGIDDDPRYAALVEVYPNPTTDRVTIDLSQLNWIKPTVMIRNSSGNLILSKDEVQDQRLELDVRSYAQGVYLIQIISESRLVFKKVVIRR